MKELLTPNEWQATDPELGINYPWYTNKFLEVLKTWDLSDKVIFEYGLGGSTLWYSHKVKKQYGVDSDEVWMQWVGQYLNDNGKFPYLLYETDPNLYPSSIYRCQTKFDIVVVDGIERDACVPMALDCLKDDGILIIDNYQQPSVWMAEERTLNILSKYECHVFKHEGHYDWQTAYFIK